MIDHNFVKSHYQWVNFIVLNYMPSAKIMSYCFATIFIATISHIQNTILLHLHRILDTANYSDRKEHKKEKLQMDTET